MYSFTHTKIDFLFKHLPTEIFISKSVCYQMKCFGGDSFFLFLEAGFANISSTFTISREVQTRYPKTLRYSQQYICDHLSGTKVRTWICSEYDAVISFSCIASYNLIKSFSFSCMSFLYENQTLNYSNIQLVHASEILLFKVFANACKLTGKMSIDWSVFLGV